MKAIKLCLMGASLAASSVVIADDSTPFPEIQKTPRTECSQGVECTQKQFNALKSEAEKQWAITPNFVRWYCGKAKDLPELDGCLIKVSQDWVNIDPNDPLKWLPGNDR